MQFSGQLSTLPGLSYSRANGEAHFDLIYASINSIRKSIHFREAVLLGKMFGN